MSFRQVLALSGLLILSGCLYHAREHTDAAVAEIVSHPYDVAAADIRNPGSSAGTRSKSAGKAARTVGNRDHVAENRIRAGEYAI